MTLRNFPPPTLAAFFGAARRPVRLGSLTIATLVLVTLGGCTRKQHRENADEEVYSRTRSRHGRNAVAPCRPSTPSIRRQSSRLFDPSDPDRPLLPRPEPSLYGYDVTPRLTGSRAADVRGPTTDNDAGGTRHEREHGFRTSRAAHPRGLLGRHSVRSVSRGCSSSTVSSPSTVVDSRPILPPPCATRRLDSTSGRSSTRRSSTAASTSRRKETLFRTALALTFERFQYFPKFFGRGNGVDADWQNIRRNGETTESAGISSGFGFDALLATGGRLLASFTNNVVLTFGGTEGFSREVSSEILVNFSQSTPPA